MLTQANREGLFDVLMDLDEKLPVGGTPMAFKKVMLANCARAHRYILAWRAAFALCEDAAETAEDAMLMVQQCLSDLGLTISDIHALNADPNFVPSVHFELS